MKLLTHLHTDRPMVDGRLSLCWYTVTAGEI